MMSLRRSFESYVKDSLFSFCVIIFYLFFCVIIQKFIVNQE